MNQNVTQTTELRVGSAVLSVAPEVGGVITRYASDYNGQAIEWLRPARPEAILRLAPGDTSCFPMIPFSNRIRNAQFHFRGRLIDLVRNFDPEPHAIHGHGWRVGWDVIEATEVALTLEYTHAADAWPWAYRARQEFVLGRDDLRVRLSVTNEATQPMPVGFGLHPYFVRTPRARLRADVGPMWQVDSNKMPIEVVDAPASLRINGGGLNPDTVTLDNNFLRFGGRAVAEWPEWDARLRIDADPVFRCFVVYTPAGEDFYCAEPATNCIDGFNLADMGIPDTGILVLAPNETTSGTVTFTPEIGIAER